MPKYVSTAEVSAALGVSVSTVKRWVDRGVLKADKTAGGHRKLVLADVVRLARDRRLPHADLSVLLAADAGEVASVQPSVDGLVKALQQGDGSAVEDLVFAAYRSGKSIAAIADELVAPAMHEIGDGWECGQLDVMHEHRATQLCSAALFGLRGEIEPVRSIESPIAVIGSPEGDPYTLAALLIETMLIEYGWNAVNLGPNTPFASFERAVEELKPNLVCLSVSYLADTSRFIEQYQGFFAYARRQSASVAIGGRELTPELTGRLSFDCYAASMTELDAFAKRIHPSPEPPKRGRPGKTPETAT